MNRYCGGRLDLGLAVLAGPHCARPAGRRGGPTGRSVTEAVPWGHLTHHQASHPSCPELRLHRHSLSLLGLRTKMPQTGCGLSSRNFFLTVVEAGSPRSRGLQVWFLLRPLSLAYRRPPSCCVLTWPFLCGCTSVVSLPLPIRTPVLLD